MGRGRAKAKQTKVARELKYREFNTDFTELQRELHGDSPEAPSDGVQPPEESLDAPFPEYDDTSPTPRR
jgi:DUF3073 family protein